LLGSQWWKTLPTVTRDTNCQHFFIVYYIDHASNDSEWLYCDL
jgi:hypothetical protein